jgi:RNase P subunit RPR2
MLTRRQMFFALTFTGIPSKSTICVKCEKPIKIGEDVAFRMTDEGLKPIHFKEALDIAMIKRLKG